MTRRAKTSPAIEHRVEKPEEHQAEIVLLEQQSLGIAGALFACRSGGLHFSEPSPEIIQQFQTGEFLFVDLVLGVAHKRTKTEGI